MDRSSKHDITNIFYDTLSVQLRTDQNLSIAGVEEIFEKVSSKKLTEVL